ncbi:uncharacterized protein si:ch211-286b5.2 isoform X2 [Myxocyprinus asiaticus]|uniref:uncharacterized protein si:ch211-286b5.2 isoform X2 n=1 Tax=Myxocyprinus asiaticus TaxID=70543 RepID=UPI00222292BA|nr:uncharacterized protein si:ch211-286b5.2 isoform X2 [Myxocyprinus asiaticus]
MPAEFKPPQRTQCRVKRQRSSGAETDLQLFQTSKSGNDHSHYASRSEEQNDCQPEQSTLQINETTEFHVAPCDSLEDNDNDEHGSNPEVPSEMEQTALIGLETPEPNNNDKCTLSEPLNLEVTNFDQPDIELDDKESETTTSNSNQESQALQVALSVLGDCDPELPSDNYQTGREMSHDVNEENTATEEKVGGLLGCSDIVAVALAEEGSVQPPIKRRVRRRMGMCWPGDRKRKHKEQHIRGNMIGGGQKNVAATSVQVVNELSVMMSNSMKKDSPVSVDKEGTTEPELSGPSFPTSCPLKDIPLKEEQVDLGNDVQDLIMVESMPSNPNTLETANASPCYPNADAPSLLETKENVEMLSVEDNDEESNIIEEKPLFASEMSNDPGADARDPTDVTTEIGTKVSEGFTENCKESTEVSVDVLKEATEASPSTCEIDKNVEEPLEGVFNVMEVEECGRHEYEMNPSIMFAYAHNEKCGLEQLSMLSENGAEELNMVTEIVINDRADKCVFAMDAADVTAENTTICEDNGMRSLSLLVAPPIGEEGVMQYFVSKTELDIQSITGPNSPLCDANEPHLSPGADQQSHPDTSSPISIHSVTDSQLNNISLELEDHPFDLEDFTELVCGLIKDLASLNQTLMDAHRMIGLVQQGSRPPRPHFHSTHGPRHSEI